jgi:hypothetical protein
MTSQVQFSRLLMTASNLTFPPNFWNLCINILHLEDSFRVKIIKTPVANFSACEASHALNVEKFEIYFGEHCINKILN